MKHALNALAVIATIALAACNSTEEPAAVKADAAAAPARAAQRPLTIQEQEQLAKDQCSRTTQNRTQWYRCWIGESENIRERSGYPHMDLYRVYTSEMRLIVRSIERNAFTPEQSDAMMAQAELRFNNAVAERENKSRERELDSWRQFRQYIQNPY